MKKRAVWILALLLIAGLLAGCGGLTEEKAVGTWTASWEFEGKQFSAPHDADAYLTDLFKNYMEIPPVEKRQVHAVVIVPELHTS